MNGERLRQTRYANNSARASSVAAPISLDRAMPPAMMCRSRRAAVG
jgi:hypothetical protein